MARAATSIDSLQLGSWHLFIKKLSSMALMEEIESDIGFSGAVQGCEGYQDLISSITSKSSEIPASCSSFICWMIELTTVLIHDVILDSLNAGQYLDACAKAILANDLASRLVSFTAPTSLDVSLDVPLDASLDVPLDVPLVSSRCTPKSCV